MDDSDRAANRLPLLLATAAAAYWTWNFRVYLPITDGWSQIETVLLPLSSLDLAFHEAGHAILGVFGSQFLTMAGGTLMQLALPGACLVYFALQENRSGASFALFWIGENLINVGFYAADAQLQSLILLGGVSGREGGAHDWGYMLGVLGKTKDCLGIGQTIFFCGCWLMVFALAWFLVLFRRYFRTGF